MSVTGCRSSGRVRRRVVWRGATARGACHRLPEQRASATSQGRLSSATRIGCHRLPEQRASATVVPGATLQRTIRCHRLPEQRASATVRQRDAQYEQAPWRLCVLAFPFSFFSRRSIMLVLNRKVGEEIVIAGNIRVRVIRSRRGRVRLALDAPRRRRAGAGRQAQKQAALATATFDRAEGARVERRRPALLPRAGFSRGVGPARLLRRHVRGCLRDALRHRAARPAAQPHPAVRVALLVTRDPS